MKIELRGLDAERGEAVLWHAGRWYLLRKERRWYPEDLGDRQPAWLAEPRFVQARKAYSTFAGLAADLEEMVRLGESSVLAMRSRLRSTAEPETGGPAAWRSEIPHLVHLYQSALDRLFARRGCTPEESRPLVLETFRRLFLLGPVDADEAAERLPLLAAGVYRDVHGDREPAPGTPDLFTYRPRGPNGPNRLALAAMEGFEASTLRCLLVWADPACDEAYVASLLQLPEDEVRRRLDRAAKKLGRTRDEIRGLHWRRGFSAALRRRVGY